MRHLPAVIPAGVASRCWTFCGRVQNAEPERGHAGQAGLGSIVVVPIIVTLALTDTYLLVAGTLDVASTC
jgi:hypothetical protein